LREMIPVIHFHVRINRTGGCGILNGIPKSCSFKNGREGNAR
jgi:hypothetical protein